MALNIIDFGNLEDQIKFQPIIFLVYEEDFESPVVSGYDNGTLPIGWLISDTGFGNGSIGLNNADSTDWTSPDSSDTQGIDANYTNSGAATDVGELETIDLNNVKYTLEITVAYDKALSGKPGATPGGNASGKFDLHFAALPDGFDRRDWSGPGENAWDAVSLFEISDLEFGEVPNDDAVHTFSKSYTTDPVTDAALVGRDLAIGINGDTSDAIITSVKVTKQFL